MAVAPRARAGLFLATLLGCSAGPARDAQVDGAGGGDVATSVGGASSSGGASGTVGGAAGGAVGGAAGASAADPTVDTRPIVSASVSGYQLLVRRRNPDGSVAAPAPYDLRGVAWSPSAIGERGPSPAAFATFVDTDAPLMRAAHINTVKTYGPIDRGVLDRLLPNGVVAIVTVLARATDDYATVVSTLRSHPAVLMWLVGNEWNRNSLYGTCTGSACAAVVNQVAVAVKALDPDHPVATSFGPTAELPTDADLQSLPAIDVWGLNVYSQPGFFGRFAGWSALTVRVGTPKPFFFSEYGADAYNNLVGREDQAAQAAALTQQTQEIRAQLSARDATAPCLGGTPFEWSDEWWKNGAATTQDVGGNPNGGVAPDQFANEDWWGMVDVNRQPRQAYTALQGLYAR